MKFGQKCKKPAFKCLSPNWGLLIRLDHLNELVQVSIAGLCNTSCHSWDKSFQFEHVPCAHVATLLIIKTLSGNIVD